jgi:hypothetical protein
MIEVRTGLRKEMTMMREELRGEMAEMRTELRGEMAEMRTELRGEMAEMGATLRNEMRSMKDEILLYFDVAVENFKDGLRTINTETLRDHGMRIGRLETHVGLPRAT